jgi:hypothetical protein
MRRIHRISTAAALAIAMGAAGTMAVTSAQAQTVASSRAGQQPAQPAAAGRPTVGVDLYVDRNYSLADVTEWGTRDLDYIRDALGLRAVSIDWDYNVPGVDSNKVEVSASRTPTIADLSELTKIARSLGLRVQYRALFAINNSDRRDGSIKPANLKTWLGSLLSTEKPALELAEKEGVPEFVVGTEMASIDKPMSDWDTFFKDAGKVYKGSLSYASYGGHTNDDGGFFSKSRVDFPTADLGATAYPGIDVKPNTTVEVLTKRWEDYLTADASPAILARTSLDEVGIPAVGGMYWQPWNWDDLAGKKLDETIQADWYRAACGAATAEHLRGIYFWSFTLNDNPAKPFDSLVGFLGHPEAVRAVATC